MLEVKENAPRFVLSASHPVGGLALIPDGIAVVHRGTLWLASSKTRELAEIETGPDPHGLVSDGKWLYWLGHEDNGKLNLRTKQKGHVPQFAPAAWQRGLASGDVLYGLGKEGRVFSIRNGHVRTANFGDPGWTTTSSIEAGDRILAFPAVDRVDKTGFLWRREVRGKGLRIDADVELGHAWSLHNDGRVVFFLDDKVMRLERNATTPRPLFDKGDLSALCWCGSDVCGISETAGELRLHRRGKPGATVVTRGVEKIGFLRCNADNVAWTTAGPQEGNEVHLAPITRRKLTAGTPE